MGQKFQFTPGDFNPGLFVLKVPIFESYAKISGERIVARYLLQHISFNLPILPGGSGLGCFQTRAVR